MAIRKLGRLVMFSTKTALGAGVVYYYYETGLWKGSEETIKNYEKVKSDWDRLYKSSPPVLVSTISEAKGAVVSSIHPYKKAVSEFQQEWLNFELPSANSGDGLIKPLWNKSITWTVAVLLNSPDMVKRLGCAGWKKLGDLTS